MTTQSEQLPYGIGRFTGRWVLLIVVLLAIISFGVFAYSRQLSQGLVVTGMRDIGTMGGAPWGLYITFDVYFVGVSFAGITVAALIRLLNLKRLKPISRMAELLTVISLIMAGLVILPDLGQPLRGLVNLFRYARPQSPFFGTFTLVISGYLFGSMVYLYLDSRRDAAIMAQKTSRFQRFYRLWAAGYKDTPAERERHQKASFWLAIAILPLLVTATTTLGFVFGLQVGRPGWFSALQGPGFVALAGVSGVGLLMIITAIVRRVLGAESRLKTDIFKILGNFLMILILVYLYFMVVELMTNIYAGDQHEAQLTKSVLQGEFSWLYWGVVAALLMTLVIQVQQYLPIPMKERLPVFWPRLARVSASAVVALVVMMAIQSNLTISQSEMALSPGFSNSLPWLLLGLFCLFIISILPQLRRNIIASSVLSGVLVNFAAIGKRYLIVVPSQTHGTLMPYLPGSYNPTWVEYSIILGLFALGALLFILFMKMFPILEVSVPIEGGD